MSVLKSSFYLAISTGVKVLLGALSLKIITYYIGSDGFGVLGQFMSLISIISLTACAGINNGIIGNVSKNKDSSEAISNIISAGFWIGLFFSLLVLVLLVSFSDFISVQLFKEEKYSFVIKILSVVQCFNIFLIIIGGYLNGIQNSKEYSLITITSSVLGTSILAILVHYYKEVGSMFGLIIVMIFPGLSFFILYLMKYRNRIKISNVKSLKKKIVKSLSKHSVMLVFSASLLPLSQVFIREIILKQSNWSEVGLWQSAFKLSEAGVLFLTVIMANYYYPEIGKSKNETELMHLIKKTFLILIPLLIVYLLIVYFFREVLITIFFDASFLPAQNLLTWQALGDSFRVLCLVFGFLVVFNENLKVYLAFELFLFLIIITSSYFFISKYGTIGANYAYSVSYLTHFIVGMLFLKFKLIDIKK